MSWKKRPPAGCRMAFQPWNALLMFLFAMVRNMQPFRTIHPVAAWLLAPYLA